MSIITVQASTELKSQPIYELNTNHNLPDGLIPLLVDLKVNHKLLNIPVLNTSYNRVYIPRSIVFRTLKPLDTENAKVNEISWTKFQKLNEKHAEHRTQKLCHHSKTNN